MTVRNLKNNKLVYPIAKIVKPEIIQLRHEFVAALEFFRCDHHAEALKLFQKIVGHGGGLQKMDCVLSTMSQFYILLIDS